MRLHTSPREDGAGSCCANDIAAVGGTDIRVLEISHSNPRKRDLILDTPDSGWISSGGHAEVDIDLVS